MSSRASSNYLHIPITAGIEAPPKEGKLKCYKCGQKGHFKPQYSKLKGKQRIARAQIKDVVGNEL